MITRVLDREGHRNLFEDAVCNEGALLVRFAELRPLGGDTYILRAYGRLDQIED